MSNEINNQNNKSTRVDPLIKRYQTLVPRGTMTDKNKKAFFYAMQKVRHDSE